MTQTVQLDVTGRRRSPATLSGFHNGRSPPNKGPSYPADPPRVEEIVAVMRAAGERPQGLRMRGLIAVLWRAGLRISAVLTTLEHDRRPVRMLHHVISARHCLGAFGEKPCERICD